MIFARNGCQCFIRIFLRFGVAGWKVVTNGKSFVLGIKLRDSNGVRLGLFPQGREGSSVRRVKNSFFFNSSYEFFLNRVRSE